MRILIVEDDIRLADALQRGLRERGHIVEHAATGDEGEVLAVAGGFDAIVLDLNLPGRDGLDVLRALRARSVTTPLLVATSRDETEDVVAGLDAGADDYIRKPFALRELEARLRSVLRRPAASVENSLQVGNLVYDLASHRVTRGDRVVEFTARELAFLEYFMRNAGRVLTRPMIENALWDRSSDTISNVVDVYVRRLRVKIDVDREPALIHTVRGMGYRMGTA